MAEESIPAPLAGLGGVRPAAPRWFDDALARPPERSMQDIAGTKIEMLTWGDVGKPGLLLMHGNGAHADWWSFVAPFFADQYRVAAFSWSGMGRSDWRPWYSTDMLVTEAFAIAEKAELFAAPVKPIFLGHSFGGVPTVAAAATSGERLRGAIILDIPMISPAQRKEREAKRKPRREPRATVIYPTLEEALVRFRFLPEQPCENAFIADYIARGSLKQVTREDGSTGWTWRFDPFLWKNFTWRDSEQDFTAAKCPMAVMWGGHSKLMPDAYVDHMRSLQPHAPFVCVPEAEHHVWIDQPLAFVAAVRGLLSAWPEKP